MMNESSRIINQGLAVVDFTEDDYDPLADEEFEEQETENSLEAIGYVGDPWELAPKSVVPPAPKKTPCEKINDLFANMIPFKRYLLSILEFCINPRDFVELDDFVTELQSKRRTIYSTVDFCIMLENVEALSMVTEEGDLYDAAQVEPVEVERDGQVYIEASNPPPVFWKITEAGLQTLEEDNPIKALQEVFKKEAKYKSVFLQILEICDQDVDVSINELKDTVDKNPVLEFPHKTTLFFLDYLDRNGAVIWDRAWKTTTVGKQALELLRAELQAEGDV